MIALITGSAGQLGRSFQKIAPEIQDCEFHFLNKMDLDITNEDLVLKKVLEICPDYIINCAAYTAVDKAETEQKKAYDINKTAVDHLAKAALESGATLVHFSSDYVYHQKSEFPLNESDPTSPKGIYAKSKLAGEQVITNSRCKSIIIRTSWVYSPFGNNFLKTMIRLGNDRDKLTIVNDQIGSPTYAQDLAEATVSMIRQYSFIPEHKLLLNYAGNGRISWYDFAIEIFRQTAISVEVLPIPTSDYPTPAPRPKWSVMDMTQLKEVFGLERKDWKEGLATCLAILK